VIQLPKSVGLLSKLASKEQARYGGALNSIHVAANGTEYKLVSTDGQVLGVLRGSVIPPGMEACVLIPVSAWDHAFKFCPKDGHIELHEQKLIAVGKAQTEVPFDPINGRFPEWLRVMPAEMPLVRIRVNPAILIRLLQVADAVSRTHEAQANTVELFVYNPQKPIGVVAIGQDVIFDGIVMPLT